MRKKIIASLAIFALFTLAIAAYAYTSTTPATTAAASCCKKDGDSCPMKGKAHDDKGEHAKMSCCQKHGEDHAKGDQHAKAEGHSCCARCIDSCPMKKDGATAVSSDGKSCCDDCECCKGKKDTSTV